MVHGAPGAGRPAILPYHQFTRQLGQADLLCCRHCTKQCTIHQCTYRVGRLGQAAHAGMLSLWGTMLPSVYQAPGAGPPATRHAALLSYPPLYVWHLGQVVHARGEVGEVAERRDVARVRLPHVSKAT